MRLFEESKLSEESSVGATTPLLWKNQEGIEIDLNDAAAIQQELDTHRRRYTNWLKKQFQKEPPKQTTRNGKVVSKKFSTLQWLTHQAKRNNRTFADELQAVIDQEVKRYKAELDKIKVEVANGNTTVSALRLKESSCVQSKTMKLHEEFKLYENMWEGLSKQYLKEATTDTMIITAEAIGEKIIVAKKDLALAKKLDRKACDIWESAEERYQDEEELCAKLGIEDFSGIEIFSKLADEAGLKFDLVEDEALNENMWYRIDDAIAASHSNTIFALVQYWKPRQKGTPELINFDGIFVDKAEAFDRYALVSNHPSLGDKLIRIDLVQFTNLSKDEIDSIRAYDYAKVFSTANYTVLASTSSKGPESSSYKYYYVVCILEEAFSNPMVLSAGTIKIDLSKVSAHETPEELAMTDYFDRTEIVYSDDWDDDMWDYLTRYVYEINAATYETEAGLPKTDADILKYVENRLADYEE